MKPFITTRQSEKFVLDNAYEIVVPIGRGRHSVVYKARCLPSAPVAALNGKQIALKVILNGAKGETFHFQRTRREALALLACAHSNVVKLIDYVARESMCYLAMEYVSRSDLKQVLDKQRVPFSVETAFELLRQLLNGLEAVHRVGIVHRDIKPENLLITDDYMLKIADFGIAYIPSQSAGAEWANDAVGTFDYLAPESLESGAQDPRADLYSAGVTLYQLITGELPFTGATFTEQIANKLAGNRKPLTGEVRQVYPLLELFFDKALSSDPAIRFQSAGEFRAAVEAFLNGRWKPDAELLARRPSTLFTTRPEIPAIPAFRPISTRATTTFCAPSTDDSLHKLKAIDADAPMHAWGTALAAKFQGVRESCDTDAEREFEAGVFDLEERSDLSDSQILERVELDEIEGRAELGSSRFFGWAAARRYVPSVAFVLCLGGLCALLVMFSDARVHAMGLVPNVRIQVERAQTMIHRVVNRVAGRRSDAAVATPIHRQPITATAPEAQSEGMGFAAFTEARRAGLLYGLLSDDTDVSLSSTVDSDSKTVTLVLGLPGVKPVVLPIEELKASSQLVIPVQGLLISLRVAPAVSMNDIQEDSSGTSNNERVANSATPILGGTYEELISGRVGSWRVW